LIEVFRILNGISVVSVDTFFALSDNTRTRGHLMKLLKRRCNKDLRHHFFSEIVVNRWNKLPSYTVEAKSVNQFKSALQKLRTTQAACYHHTLSDELLADQVNDQVNDQVTAKTQNTADVTDWLGVVLITKSEVSIIKISTVL